MARVPIDRVLERLGSDDADERDNAAQQAERFRRGLNKTWDKLLVVPRAPALLRPWLRLTVVLGMLGSDHAGERISAALHAERIRRELGLSWAELLGWPRASNTAKPSRPVVAPRPSQYDEPTQAQIELGFSLAIREQGVMLGELNRIACWQKRWLHRLGRLGIERGYRYDLVWRDDKTPIVHLRRPKDRVPPPHSSVQLQP